MLASAPLAPSPQSHLHRAEVHPFVPTESIGPGLVLQKLFSRNPLGKNRDEPITPRRVQSWLADMLRVDHCPRARVLYFANAPLLGWRLLALLRRSKVEVEFLKGADYRGRRRQNTSALYFPRRRLISINADQLSPTGSTIFHEFGHAIEYLINRVCLRNHSVSTMLWHGFAPERKAFVTDYAQTKPREYFAESVTAFFFAPEWAWMQKHDPGMAAFVQALFELSHL